MGDISVIISVISLSISVGALAVNLFSTWLKQPRVIFSDKHTDSEDAIYFKTPMDLESYKGSSHIAVVKVELYNNSSVPITIGSFSIDSFGKKEAYYGASTKRDYTVQVFDDQFAFYDEDARNNLFPLLELDKDSLEMPLTLMPYGYAKGFVVFPFIKGYTEDTVPVEIKAYTAKKVFSWNVTMTRCFNTCVYDREAVDKMEMYRKS